MSSPYEVLRAAVEKARVALAYHLQTQNPDAQRVLTDLTDILDDRGVAEALGEAAPLAPDTRELPEPTLLGDNVVPLHR
jgi:hypothetical protein